MDGWKELEFAAELGPTKFVKTWFSEGNAAVGDCFVISVRDVNVKAKGKEYLPRKFGWELVDEGQYDAVQLAEEWASGADEAKRRGDKGGAIIRHICAVQGNAVGVLASKAGNDELAWKVHYRVFKELEKDNISNLINLQGLTDRGYQPNKLEKRQVEDELKGQMAMMRGQRQLQRAMEACGRVHVDEATRQKVANLREELKRKAWESEEHKEVVSAFKELDRAQKLRGEELKAAIAEVEKKHLRQISNSRNDDITKWFFIAEVHAFKEGEENLRIARENYRKILESGNAGQVDLIADRLLSMDISLGDMKAMEYDALLVLRTNLRHKYANALLGSLRASAGKHESAERYLRRAMEVGESEPGMKNDLALALSGQGKHEEAEFYAREAVGELPESWSYHETLAQVLKAAGKKEEAEKELKAARELATKAGQLEDFKEMTRTRK